MATGNLDATTLVIDDWNVHYNISRAIFVTPQLIPELRDSFAIAKSAAWNESLTVITESGVGFWQNITGYTHVAVFGSILPPAETAGFTAWANYTIDGNYTAVNVTSSSHVITDYPLFVSGELDPKKQYNLTVEVAASPLAPYLLDYILAYHSPNPIPLVSTSSTMNTKPTNSGSSNNTGVTSLSDKHLVIYIAAGLGAGIVILFIVVAMLLKKLCCSRRRKSTAVDTPALPEPPFPPRPQKSATSSSTMESSRKDGSSQAFTSPPSSPPQTRAPSTSVSTTRAPVSLPTLPTQYAPRHRPAPTSVPGPSPPMMQPMMQEAVPAQSRRPSTSPALTGLGYGSGSGSGSRSNLDLSSAMATPPAVQHSDPFTTPAPDVSKPLYNPYDTYLVAAAALATAPTSAAVERSTSGTSGLSASTAPSGSPSGALLHTRSNTVVSAGQSTSALSSAPGPSAVMVPATSTSASASTSAGLALGSNEYPKEKQEIRLEPPQRLYAVNTDAYGTSSGDPYDVGVGPSDSPPAYGA